MKSCSLTAYERWAAATINGDFSARRWDFVIAEDLRANRNSTFADTPRSTRVLAKYLPGIVASYKMPKQVTKYSLSFFGAGFFRLPTKITLTTLFMK